MSEDGEVMSRAAVGGDPMALSGRGMPGEPEALDGWERDHVGGSY